MRGPLRGTQQGLGAECRRCGREALQRRQINAILLDITETILLIHSSVNCVQNMSKHFKSHWIYDALYFL